MSAIVLVVNDEERRIDAPPEESLLSVLRNRLDLTGTKYGCGEGQCGACTLSCSTARLSARAWCEHRRCAGKKITTIEGLAQNGKLHPLQEAFIQSDAMQCGYCTPGHDPVAVSACSKEDAEPSASAEITPRARRQHLPMRNISSHHQAAVQMAATHRTWGHTCLTLNSGYIATNMNLKDARLSVSTGPPRLFQIPRRWTGAYCSLCKTAPSAQESGRRRRASRGDARPPSVASGCISPRTEPSPFTPARPK